MKIFSTYFWFYFRFYPSESWNEFRVTCGIGPQIFGGLQRTSYPLPRKILPLSNPPFPIDERSWNFFEGGGAKSLETPKNLGLQFRMITQFRIYSPFSAAYLITMPHTPTPMTLFNHNHYCLHVKGLQVRFFISVPRPRSLFCPPVFISLYFVIREEYLTINTWTMISLFGSKRKNNPERSLPRRGNKNQLEKSLAVTEAKLMMQEKLMKPGEIGPWLVGSSTNSLGIIYRNFSSYAFNILSIYI